MKFKDYINESAWPTKIEHSKKTHMDYKSLSRNTLNWFKSAGVMKFKPYAVYSDKGRMEVMTNLPTSDVDDSHRQAEKKLRKPSSKVKHLKYVGAEDQQGMIVLVFQDLVNTGSKDDPSDLDWMDDYV